MSSPRFIVPAAASLIGVVLCVAYLPGLAEESEFRMPWVSVALVAAAAALATYSNRRGGRGWGSLATLLDNGLHVGSLAWAAANTTRPFGFFFCALIAGMLAVFQGSAYGFTLLMAAVILGPPLVIVLWLGPDPMVSLALLVACALGLLRMEMTGALRRRAKSEKEPTPRLTTQSGASYRIGSLVGAGGMGIVYRATTDTGREVAVKRLHSHWFESPHEWTRLFREAVIVNSLSHPGVVPVVDHGTDEQGAPFLVMELLAGRTLRQRLEASEDRLAWQEVARIAAEVLDVLAAAHTHGVVHCDVKPSNVFLCDDGRIRLLDFGIARPPEGLLDTTVSGRFAGTPACMAPEQVLSPKAVDGRADLWAVGAAMFRALTGEWPRQLPEPCTSLLDVARLPVRSLQTLAPGLPAELVLAVDKALAVEPERRWPTARAMQECLLRVSGHRLGT
jgi:hypothetical protein